MDKEDHKVTILVTGGTGYIGSHTVVELIENDYDVVIIDNLSNSDPEVLERLYQITGQHVPFYHGDIRDAKILDQIFNEHTIDGVIHFAGLKSVGESVEQPIDYYQNNVAGSLTLLEVMQAHEVERIVYSSSATVYGAHNQSPLDESMPIGEATNPYGYSKIVVEQMIHDLVKSNPAWSAVMLRYFNPIGAHQSGLIGEEPSGIPANIMPYLTQVAIGKLPVLRVYGNDYSTQDGTGVRDYIHVVDLAKAHVKALQYTLDQSGYQIYNLGTGKGYSVLELVHTFEAVTGQSIPLEYVDRRAGDLAEVYANPALAAKELHWQAEYNLEDMCRDSWRWQSQNVKGYKGD